MAASTTELQLIFFDYVMDKVNEVSAILKETANNPDLFEEFAIAFEEVSEKKDELLANYFALCAVPPKPEVRTVDELGTAFVTFERLFRQLRIEHNRCTVRAADLTSRATFSRAVLPPLPLPVFSGSRAEWASFSELFKSIVHQDVSLSNVQKLHYLIGCLKDEPRELVSNLPLTNENYEVIWSLLEKKYQNLRIAATIHVQKILHLPSVHSNPPDSLSRFVSVVQENLNALRADNFPVSEWSFLLLNILLEKLDSNLRESFEIAVEQDLPTCDHLLAFLERRAVANENVKLLSVQGNHEVKTSTVGRSYNRTATFSVKPPFRPTSGRSTALVAVGNVMCCAFCNENHSLSKCEHFLSKNIDERMQFVKEQNMCFNCLKKHHYAQRCLSKFSCNHCQKRHHSVLHFNHNNHPTQPESTQNDTNDTPAYEPFVNKLQSLHLSGDNQDQSTTILLTTALVHVRDGSGQFQVVRALLDGASQTTFLTEDCVQRLGLKRHRQNVEIAGVGQTPVPGARGIVHCSIKPVDSQHIQFNVKGTVLSEITHPMPCSRISQGSVTHLKGLKLADPSFDKPGPVDMLLSADIVSEVLTGAKLPGEPNAFHSLFGWVVSGKAMCETHVNPLVSCLIRTTNLDVQLQKFWEIEEVPSVDLISDDDKKCEDHFLATHERNAEGRYMLRLPFNQEVKDMGHSLHSALSRFEHLECRLKKSPDLAKEYSQFLKEYECLGHMTRVTSIQHIQGQDDEIAYVIPHHAVLKESSSTTKLRVVFDGSAATSKGISLNDVLLTGPKLHKNIGDILLNFRTRPVVFTADICKMYRQIQIHPDDWKYQCILWRPSPEESVHVYQLKTVTYGLASSPYQALRTLQQLALDEAQKYPQASKTLLRDVFVDDIVTGANSVEEAVQLKCELVDLLAQGGFELRKWSSNNSSVLEDMPVAHCETLRSFDQDTSPAVKVLGIHWCPITDEFMYHINVPHLSVTKRGILSTIARLFDPCGWVSPVIVWVKILLQTLWTLGLEWDQPVNAEVAQQWLHFRTSLSSLTNVRIPRYIHFLDACCIQFHGFCDASEKAYAAVIYVRLVDKTGMVSTHLVIAKSKVAPLKTLSIPRLELLGAMLLAKLWLYVNTLFESRLDNFTMYMWSDSTTVLSWLKSSPHKFKAFVANRVSEIQAITPPGIWRYVPSVCNPADLASRGVYPDQLIESSLWFHGPDWLVDSDTEWPVNKFEVSPFLELPECKPVQSQALAVQEDRQNELVKLLETFSSFSKLKRVTAWILRAKSVFSKLPHCDSKILKCEEMHSALMFWIHVVQHQYFMKEIKLLKRNECSSNLRSLYPFIDSLGIVRVGGRLQYACLPESTKHPVLLPGKCHLSKLIVTFYHVTYLHAGPQATQSLIQRQFWIVGARHLIRHCIHRCIACFRLTARSPAPLMGNLPSVRFSQVRPFLKVGVDFAGPFSSKTTKTRKAPISKSYLCLFVCMSSKATHLEVLSSLCTEAFLAALKRFVSLRGTPSDIHSDQGKNFIGADRHMKEIRQALFTEPAWQMLQDHLADLNIVWHFNPPAGPHFGGLWEAAVKSAKVHMKRVIGNQILTFEELTTLFTEISAILNSRPLCPLSADPSEFDVLTPGHFLIGAPLVGIPEQDLSHLLENRLDRWQLITKLKQCIWKRWSTEYLHTLHQRTKWNTAVPNVKENALVLVKDSNLPPLK